MRRPRQRFFSMKSARVILSASQLRKKAIPAKKRGKPDITQTPRWNEGIDMWHEERVALKRYQGEQRR